jgi:hypothetical protein
MILQKVSLMVLLFWLCLGAAGRPLADGLWRHLLRARRAEHQAVDRQVSGSSSLTLLRGVSRRQGRAEGRLTWIVGLWRRQGRVWGRLSLRLGDDFVATLYGVSWGGSWRVWGMEMDNLQALVDGCESRGCCGDPCSPLSFVGKLMLRCAFAGYEPEPGAVEGRLYSHVLVRLTGHRPSGGIVLIKGQKDYLIGSRHGRDTSEACRGAALRM